MKNTAGIMFLACVLLLIGNLGQSLAQTKSPQATRQRPARVEDKEFAKQWKEVKEKYPAVAMEYLRREAFAYQMGKVVLAQQQTVEGRRFAVGASFVCYFYERFGLPLPDECRQVSTARIGDIGSCFEPKPSMSGGYEMPSVDQAETCVQEQLHPR